MSLKSRYRKGSRILGIDDGVIEEKSIIIGVVFREGEVEGVCSTFVKKDGNDATEKIVEMIAKSRFLSQISSVAINGTTVAGANIVDIVYLFEKFSIPVMAITRKKPDYGSFEKVLRKFDDYSERRDLLIKMRKMCTSGYFSDGKRRLFVQYVGDRELVEKILHSGYAFSAVRLASIIAKGISRGESKGRI
ncbi:MAG: DUF99 family protein [Candidatus Micrarchaeaceae archaeon]